MMQGLTWRSLVAIAALAIGLFAYSPLSYAQASASTGTPSDQVTQTMDASGATISCDDIPEAKNGVLIGKIVPCMTATIQQATIRFAEKFTAAMTPIFFAFVTMVIAFYGVRILSGEPQVHKAGFAMLLKIAIIAIVMNDLGNISSYRNDGSSGGELIPTVYSVMSEMQSIVVGTVDTTSLKCDMSKYSGGGTVPPVWALMDCVSGKLFGYVGGTGTNAAGGKQANMLLVASFFGMMTGFFFGGIWGVVIFIGMLGVLFAVFMLVIRTVVSFLSSYFIVCILLIVSPLFIPLVLLRVGNQYFESFWRLILAAVITPVLVSAYAMFALIVYDKMLFADDSILNTLLKESNMQASFAPDRKPCTHPITGKPNEMRFNGTVPTAASLLATFGSPLMQNAGAPNLNASNDPCANFSIANLQTDKIQNLPSKATDAGQAAKGKFERETFKELLTLFLMAYLINVGMSTWMTMISQIVGKGAALKLANSVFGQGSKFEQGFTAGMQRAKESFTTADGKAKSGTQFIGSIPSAARDSLKAMAEQMSRRE